MICNTIFPEGIISTPKPVLWRSRSASTGGAGSLREGEAWDLADTRDTMMTQEALLTMDHTGDISDESLSQWPPSGGQKNSLTQGFYTSFNKNIFQEKSDHGEQLWSSMEYPPSPKDAFRETCEFYGDPIFSKQRKNPRNEMNGGIVNGGVAKMYRAKPKQLDFYKSETRLPTTGHYAESSGEEMEHFMNPIGRSKSLHDLQQFPPSIASGAASIHQRREAAKEQIGLSEHDLNRARSVLGLPVTEPYNAYISSNGARTGVNFEAEKNDLDLGYDSQPGSKRNSMNVSQHTNISGRR